MPEDERVAGEGAVNVPGSRAEPVGDVSFPAAAVRCWCRSVCSLSSPAVVRVAPTRATCRQACGRTGAAATLAAS